MRGAGMGGRFGEGAGGREATRGKRCAVALGRREYLEAVKRQVPCKSHRVDGEIFFFLRARQARSGRTAARTTGRIGGSGRAEGCAAL